MTTIIGLASLLVAVLSLVQGSASAPARSESEPPGTGGTSAGTPFSPEPSGGTYPARIMNTYSDEQRRFVGVRAAVSPYVSGDAGRGYLEGEQVRVRCQVRNGRLVADTVSGRAFSSTVWNKTTDGVWFPDIYSDLPKTGDKRPPPC